MLENSALHNLEVIDQCLTHHVLEGLGSMIDECLPFLLFCLQRLLTVPTRQSTQTKINKTRMAMKAQGQDTTRLRMPSIYYMWPFVRRCTQGWCDPGQGDDSRECGNPRSYRRNGNSSSEIQD